MEDPYAGIVVLVNNSMEIVNSNIVIPGRLLNIKIRYGKDEYNMSVMYGFSGKLTVQNIIPFIDGLTEHHHNNENNILLGDFNFVENDIDRVNQNGCGMNSADKRVSGTWTDYLDQAGLVDAFRARNPKRRWFSYIHTQHNSKSRLDRLYINEENCYDIFHYKYLSQTIWPKAHRILTFVLRSSTERGPGFWKMNVSILPDQAYSTIVQSTVKDVSALNIQDPIQRWLVFIETIRIETRIYCSRKKSIETRVKNVCQKRLEELEQNSLLNSRPELQSEYDHLQDKINSWYRKKN